MKHLIDHNFNYSWKIKTRVEATNLAGTNKKTQKGRDK